MVQRIKFYFQYLIFGIFFILFTSVSYGDPLDFLCGPDEDGCFKGEYQYCACIPENVKAAGKPFCLDFNKMTCAPLADVPNCDPEMIFKNQGSCLATIFQSEPEPPCPLKTQTFCKQN